MSESKTEFEKARDEASKAYRDEAFKNNPNGYSVIPGMKEPDTDFEVGADFAREYTLREVEELVQACDLLREDARHYLEVILNGKSPEDSYGLGRHDTYVWVKETLDQVLANLKGKDGKG